MQENEQIIQALLHKLWHGEEENFYGTPDIQEAALAMCACSRELRDTLSEEQCRLLDRLEASEGEYHWIVGEKTFSHAFTLGARMMLEVLTAKVQP